MSDETNGNMLPDDGLLVYPNAHNSEPEPPRAVKERAAPQRVPTLSEASKAMLAAQRDEDALIGCVVLDPEALHHPVVLHVTPQAFTGARQRLWRRIRELDEQNMLGEGPTAIAAALHGDTALTHLSGGGLVTYLHHCSEAARHANNTPIFARALTRRARTREALVKARLALAEAEKSNDADAVRATFAALSSEFDNDAKAHTSPLRTLLAVPSEWLQTPLGPMPMLLRHREWTPVGGSDPLDEGLQDYLAAGIVAMLAAPGGAGKTRALIQLAVSVATGLPWLKVFEVARKGRVLLVLGEEDGDTMRRRLWDYTSGLSLSEARQADLLANLKMMPGRGAQMRLIDEDGNETSAYHDLRATLTSSEPWSLVILDPAARFLPAEAEKDNAVATRFIETLERLAMQGTGQPTVLFAHHTNKGALGSKESSPDDQGHARGSSALTDGVRWQANIVWKKRTEAEKEKGSKRRLFFAHAKQNYGPRVRRDIELKHDAHGVHYVTPEKRGFSENDGYSAPSNRTALDALEGT